MNLDELRQFRIIVSDGHPVFREGLIGLVLLAFPNADVREAGTFAETIGLAEQDAPDLFLLDLLFPGMEPKTSVLRLREACPNARIAIVSMVEDQASIDAMMGLGIDAYIAKNVAYDKMVAVLRDVAAGKRITALSDRPPLWSAAMQSATDASGFTPRQRDVLALLIKGKSNKEIGRLLAISPFTVRIHVSALLRLLRVNTRTEAAAVGRSMRLDLKAGN